MKVKIIFLQDTTSFYVRMIQVRINFIQQIGLRRFI